LYAINFFRVCKDKVNPAQPFINDSALNSLAGVTSEMAAMERKAVLSLYRLLLKEASKFNQYSYRSYAVARVQDYFRQYKDAADHKEVQKAYEFGKENLEILKRQVLINSLYFSDKLVIENK
jgi:hypothetical protein